MELTSLHQAHVLIQGASRGIGLALCQQLLACTQVQMLHACCRHPEDSAELQALCAQYGHRLQCHVLDLECEVTIAKAAEAVKVHSPRLALLVNVAGVLHDAERGMQPEKRLEDIDAEHLMHAYRVNAVGPLLVARHFSALLCHDQRAVLASLSARVGSISDNKLGGWYAYRASKAAQNMLTRNLAIEFERRRSQCIVVGLHPGTTDTGLSRPFQRRVPQGKLFTPEFAARSLLSVIDQLSSQASGQIYAWDGQLIAP